MVNPISRSPAKPPPSIRINPKFAAQPKGYCVQWGEALIVVGLLVGVGAWKLFASANQPTATRKQDLEDPVFAEPLGKVRMAYRSGDLKAATIALIDLEQAAYKANSVELMVKVALTRAFVRSQRIDDNNDPLDILAQCHWIIDDPIQLSKTEGVSRTDRQRLLMVSRAAEVWQYQLLGEGHGESLSAARAKAHDGYQAMLKAADSQSDAVMLGEETVDWFKASVNEVLGIDAFTQSEPIILAMLDISGEYTPEQIATIRSQP